MAKQGKSSKMGRNKDKCARYRSRKGNIEGRKPHGPNSGRTDHSHNRSEALSAAAEREHQHRLKYDEKYDGSMPWIHKKAKKAKKS